MHYAVPRLIDAHRRLARLYTDITASAGWPRLLRHVPQVILPRAAVRLASRRVPVAREKIEAFPAFGLEYQRRRTRARSASEMTAAHLWAGERFCRLVLQSKPDLESTLYCYNSAGLELLDTWRGREAVGFLEQTIAPRRIEDEILRREEQLFPGWQPPLSEDRHTREYIEREEAEWQLAGRIVCGSDFVRRGVISCGGPADRCVVVEYGVPLQQFRPVRKPPLAGRKLRVLMVGEVGLRKGAHYALQAAKRLRSTAEIRMAGSSAFLPRRMDDLREHVDYIGVVPRGEIVRHFEWADVFLLPSLCEGSATVTYEALASGLPVVATASTGSIVEPGVSGIIVPERDADAIVEALSGFARDPGRLRDMSLQARERAEYGGLEAYGTRLMTLLSESR